VGAAIALTLAVSGVAVAQGRTDIVYLANGDRITGEVSRLERGRLEFKTDDAGTLYLEWDNLVSVMTVRFVEVMTTDGRRFLGSLGPAANRSIAVVGPEGTSTLLMPEVTFITPIGGNFWRKLDGSIDLGYSYTKSSGVSQLNLNTDTIWRRPAQQARVSVSATQTQTEDDEADDRGSVEMSYLRYPWQRWFVVGVGRFENNESLGLELRSQIAVAAGPRLVNSNRAQVTTGAGIAFNDEQGIDVEPVQNVEGLLVFQASYFTYDRPRTNLDFTLQYFPSFTNRGRRRLQLDADVKHEIFKDFFISVSVFDTYDSRPPNPEADTNDVGVVTSIGWTY
jgi:hypothetical protein